jgi:tight adherence protein B
LSWGVASLVFLTLVFAALARRSRERRVRLGASVRTKPTSSERGSSWRALLDDWRSWSVVAGAVGLALGGPVGLLFGLGCGAAAAVGRSRKRAAATAALAQDQLGDAVASMAAGMRAGLSVQRSIGYAAQEARDPLRGSLERVIDDVELGFPLDRSLSALADSGGDDAKLVAGVLKMHRRSGGDLPAVLDRVGATLADRREIDAEVRGLTAQARLSGTILGVLPVGFFAFLWLTSRSDIQAAIHNPVGEAAIGLGSLLDIVAFLWIRQILRVR